MDVSFLRNSGALYLGIFEQPADHSIETADALSIKNQVS